MFKEVKLPKKSFNERWNEVDETCPHCRQVTSRVRGLNRQNLRNLMDPRRTTMSDWIVFFMIVMILFVAYRYEAETAQCQEFIDNIETICLQVKQEFVNETLGLICNPKLEDCSGSVSLDLEYGSMNISRDG